MKNHKKRKLIPKRTNALSICIIGAGGNFGQFFTKIFEAEKQIVFPIGRKNINKLKTSVEKSDVIILAVPPEAASNYYLKLKGLVKKNQLVVDISSVMSLNKKSLEDLNCESIFLHPLFAPNVKNSKQTKYILVSVKSGKTTVRSRFISIFKDSGASVIESTVAKHEKNMAYIQALSHFNTILLAKTMSDSDITVKEIEDFSTTFFRLQFDALSRIFAQKSEIYASIQFNNNTFLNVLKSYQKNLTELIHMVENKDYQSYDKVFEKVIAKFSPLLQNSFEESQSIVQNLSGNFKKVGFLGPIGSYSEIAASYLNPEANYIATETITDVLKMINNGELNYGVVPIENSIQGSVIETVDGLYKNKLFIEKELVIPIRHCVASLTSEIIFDKVEIVMSHPQALGQCSDYIRANFPNAKQIITSSTSHAFKKIADEGLVNAVAIGTNSAANEYGLKILANNVQNTENNETKFVLVTKTFNVNSKGQISSFVIVPKKDRPGLLFDILKSFKDNNLNLIKIESRPSKLKLGTYIFSIDVNGNFKDKSIERAISAVKEESDVIFLGSYNQEKIEN